MGNTSSDGACSCCEDGRTELKAQRQTSSNLPSRRRNPENGGLSRGRVSADRNGGFRFIGGGVVMETRSPQINRSSQMHSGGSVEPQLLQFGPSLIPFLKF